MNERLTIQDLIDLLAAKHSMTKKDAEAFVKEFFLLIEQALENEKTVKIKGLGTFKLVDVDSRESVNVNTGERFQIKGQPRPHRQDSRSSGCEKPPPPARARPCEAGHG